MRVLAIEIELHHSDGRLRRVTVDEYAAIDGETLADYRPGEVVVRTVGGEVLGVLSDRDARRVRLGARRERLPGGWT